MPDKQPQLSPEVRLAPTQISGIGAQLGFQMWVPTPATSGGYAPGSGAGYPMHRPKARDQQRNPDPKPQIRPCNLINGLADCQRPHLKAPILKSSYLAPAHRALQGLPAH